MILNSLMYLIPFLNLIFFTLSDCSSACAKLVHLCKNKLERNKEGKKWERERDGGGGERRKEGWKRGNKGGEIRHFHILLFVERAPGFKIIIGISLVVQWLRIRLPKQGARVWALVREDPTCRGATKPVSHNYWSPRAATTEACAPQLQKPARLELVLRNKRSHRNEKPAHSNKDPMQPKVNK